MRPIDWRPIETKDAITILIAISAVFVGLMQYHSTSRDEFLKPVRENQLKLYMEASSAAASLATIAPGDPERKKAKMDFLRLYWGPLAVVEDYQHDLKPGQQPEITVERAMIAFKKCLDDPTCDGSAMMLNLSLALAHTCRVSIGSSWGFEAKQLQGDYSKLIEDYLKPEMK